MAHNPLPKSAVPPTSWLRHWLTVEELLDVAGPEVHERARVSLAEGRVRSLRAEPEDNPQRLRGTVLEGSRALTVEVLGDEEGLLYECQCAYLDEYGICEHSVALALAFLQPQALPRPVALEPRGGQQRPSSPQELEAWLAERQVLHLRDTALASVEPLLPPHFSARYGLYLVDHQPLTSLLEGTLSLPRSFEGPARQQLEQAAWTLALQEAERVREGLEREQSTLPRRPPVDERLAPLARALEQERARVRTQAVPRAFPPGWLHLSFSSDLPGEPVYVEEPNLQLVARHQPGQSLPGRVVVYPGRLLDREAGLACPCTPRQPAACVHALSALEALLEVLADPRRASVQAQLVEQLFEAPARHLLAAMSTVGQLTQHRQQEARALLFRLEATASGPRLRPYLHRPLKRGGLSKGSPLGVGEWSRAHALLSSPQEGEALELCRLVEAGVSSLVDDWVLTTRALRLLAGSSRLVLAERPEVPLQVREAQLALGVAEEEGGMRLQPQVGGVPVPAHALQQPPQSQAQGLPWLLVEPQVPRVTLVSVPAGAGPLLSALASHGTRLPERVRPRLLEHLESLERLLPLSLPPSLEGREVEPEAGLLLRLSTVEEEGLEGSLWVRPLPEAPPQPPGQGPEVLRGSREGERVRVQRRLAGEREQARALLTRLGVEAAEEPSHFLQRGEAALELVERLEPLTGPGLRVEWEQQPWRVERWQEGARGLKVQVRREHDWFGVRGGLALGEELVELAALLEAVRRGARYVPLEGRRWLRLTEELRERLVPLADLAHPVRGGLEVSAAAAPVLEGLEQAGARVEAPPDWLRLASRIRRAQARVVRVPEGLRARLRDYQREGFEWMARLAEWGGGGCLADDMGLGKTVQTLAVLLHRARRGPALVVAPTSVCANWVLEAERFAPSLRVRLYREQHEREALLSELGPRAVVVVSYALLVRDVERFSQVAFATLVLDEAQAVKNPDTARAQAVRQLQAEARLALSGTPVENRLSELWSLFNLIFPGLLGGRESFRRRFVVPIERDRSAQAQAALARVVRPFMLRRTKGEVARELPPRLESVVPVTLSEQERQVYEAVRLAALEELAGVGGQPQDRIAVLAALTRLRLAACHPRLVGARFKGHSAKLERLLELVESLQASGGRALVFSQFVKHLALVREALEQRGVALQYLDGSTPAAERQQRVEAFQRGEGVVFLISLKAGGTGLNLTGADHVIHMDPWWNPAVEDQATDRAHRLGQTKPVTVLRLVAEGTLEETMLGLHAHKRELAEALLAGADGAAALSTEALLALMRSGAEGGPAGGTAPRAQPPA